ncbi:MAG: replicative DNA helicase [Bifidobacteriaceae bacterium]|jgi:replicative DNA helicase|nr:replicative DNA helicase [Bifidobacteriaceae bacterium]
METKLRREAPGPLTVIEFEAPPPDAAQFDRLPPQDLEAERSALGAMLLSKDAIADVVSVLAAEDFYRPQHETVFGAITDIYSRGEPVDGVTVASELTRRGEMGRIGGRQYLADLMAGVPTAANAGYYAQIVRDRAVLRRLVEAGTRITQLGYTSDGQPVDDLVNSAQAEVYAVTERGAGEDYQHIADIINPVVDEINELAAAKRHVTGIPTGLTELDNILGGLHKGQMVIVAARPGKGKSTLGLDFARSASIRHGMASVIFSLEMSKEEITHRLLAAESNVFLSSILSGRIRQDDWPRISSRIGPIKEAPLFIDDSPNMALMEIRAKCRRLKQRHDLKLVVIDYLQLMSSGKRVESRQLEVSEFSRALKKLAKELGLPVVAISQLNRSAEQRADKKPEISDLRESGSLEQDADVVILINQANDAQDNPDRGTAELIVAKHRNGPTGSAKVAFQGHYSQFANLADDY